VTFIARGLEYKSREILLQGFDEATSGILYTLVLSIFKERCTCIGGGIAKGSPDWFLGGTVVSTTASQLQGSGFDSRFGSLSVWSL